MLYVAWKRGLPRNFARFVLFRPIKKRSFKLLCVLDLLWIITGLVKRYNNTSIYISHTHTHTYTHTHYLPLNLSLSTISMSICSLRQNINRRSRVGAWKKHVSQILKLVKDDRLRSTTSRSNLPHLFWRFSVKITLAGLHKALVFFRLKNVLNTNDSISIRVSFRTAIFYSASTWPASRSKKIDAKSLWGRLDLLLCHGNSCRHNSRSIW